MFVLKGVSNDFNILRAPKRNYFDISTFHSTLLSAMNFLFVPEKQTYTSIEVFE
jgi:hypothetical protein